MIDEGREPVEHHEIFEAGLLYLSNIPGTAEVRVGETERMQVWITGPQTLVEQILCEVQGKALHIAGPDDWGGAAIGGMVIGARSFRGNRVQMAEGVVAVDGQVITVDSDATLVESWGVRIVVEVPSGKPIFIEDRLAGSYRIGDVEGPLDIHMQGEGDVTAGRVADTYVISSGPGHVDIVAVKGRRLYVQMSGKGDVTVLDGDIKLAQLEVAGGGNAKYGGVATAADLHVSDTGNILVNAVTDGLKCLRRAATGRITVLVPPPEDPNAVPD